MSISSEMSGIYANNRQTNDVFSARAHLQHARSTILEANIKIQAIADAGSFTSIPATTLSALNSAWIALKVAETSLQASNVVEVLGWTH